ncbi:hypothetical protein AVEN_188111-1 [Araneus ventricosus]|uniref:Uncharacterized protein n=1 Tax=Araneus ventricosus TaxID=182803 RepID=A0A4Y2GA79_ARAVE|nr:hypothetical protein AVEN_44451-1 [Araneus ventricosus]GBM50715.1 hypothetical protein AVEN_123502-1 [Araneus ventricosus]GBM50722.1 hypothetical protein AVEN_127242-1 [Araneus ventricosus]GBM50729.1 hypothetical protein AVEN_188111-1 [Araneus ventricosus]
MPTLLSSLYSKAKHKIHHQGCRRGCCAPHVGANWYTLFTQRAIQLVDKARSEDNLRGSSSLSSPCTADRAHLVGQTMLPCRADSNATPVHHIGLIIRESRRENTPADIYLTCISIRVRQI